MKNADREPSGKTPAELLAEIGQSRRMCRHRSAFEDLRVTVAETGVYQIWQKILLYFRRFRFFSFLIRLAEWLLLALHTGTLVLLTTAVFAVLLPLSGVLLTGLTFIALPEAYRKLRKLRKHLNGKRICLLFSCPSGGFAEENARSLARLPDHAVFLISPYWLSPAGPGKKRFYLTVREVAPDLFLIRRYYFFLLRRKLLRKADNTVWIY